MVERVQQSTGERVQDRDGERLPWRDLRLLTIRTASGPISHARTASSPRPSFTSRARSG